MDGLTKEQKTQLKTWAEQRDAFLSENSVLRSENEKLHIANKELARANSDINNTMNEVLGRIKELKNKEIELPELISREIATLEAKKTGLESEVALLEKLRDALIPQKAILESDIEKALSVFETIKGEALLLDKVVDRVTTVSKGNTDKINLLVSNLAKSLEEIISVNRKNVAETNVVIKKLPTMLMELQKHGLIKHRQAIIKSKNINIWDT